MTLILQVTEPLLPLSWPLDSDKYLKMTYRQINFFHVPWGHSRTLPQKEHRGVQNALQVKIWQCSVNTLYVSKFMLIWQPMPLFALT